MKVLYNNFERNSSYDETVTEEEEAEEIDLITSLLNTSVMKYLKQIKQMHKYLN